jgi:hypothetical protein
MCLFACPNNLWLKTMIFVIFRLTIMHWKILLNFVNHVMKMWCHLQSVNLTTINCTIIVAIFHSQRKISTVWFGIFTLVLMEIQVVWYMMPCCWCVNSYWCFRGAWCLCLQSDEPVSSSRTLVTIYKSTQHHIPEDFNIQNQHCCCLF